MGGPSVRDQKILADLCPGLKRGMGEQKEKKKKFDIAQQCVTLVLWALFGAELQVAHLARASD